MDFQRGMVKMRRYCKVDDDSAEALVLDFLLVTEGTVAAWESRGDVDWEGGTLRVVSPEGEEAAPTRTTSSTSGASSMKIDMSPRAVRLRLEQVSALRRLCLSLAGSSAGRRIVERCPTNKRVQRTSRALGR